MHLVCGCTHRCVGARKDQWCMHVFTGVWVHPSHQCVGKDWCVCTHIFTGVWVHARLYWCVGAPTSLVKTWVHWWVGACTSLPVGGMHAHFTGGWVHAIFSGCTHVFTSGWVWVGAPTSTSKVFTGVWVHARLYRCVGDVGAPTHR